MITRKELIKKYLEYFKSKGHKEIKNSSLIPENDPTVLFTTAGMHPLVPFLLGQKHPLGKRLTNIQRCIRTGDIDEVGDTTHHTFFEMIGNWSLGDYWKKEAITWSFEFAIKILGLHKERIAVTCFVGDEDAPKDIESAEIWHNLGISKQRITFLAKESNWWGPAGLTGPCGPCTELFYWKPNKISPPKKFDANENNWVELWNDVLMQYNKDEDGNYNQSNQKNIDNGRGLERILAVLNGYEDNYLTEVWQPIINQIEKISGKTYNKNEKQMRIIADHLKAAVFILADGTIPSNIEQGYVLRRLIRRAVRYGRDLNLKNFTRKVAQSIFSIYTDYEHLQKNKEKILGELEKEENKFMDTLEEGIKIFNQLIKQDTNEGVKYHLSPKTAFLLYQSYGFPIEMTIELLKEKNPNFDFEKLKKEFRQEYEKHQELSRTASAGKFKSGLADNSEQTTKLHTATHLLLAAIKQVLKNPEIYQKGSNITAERLRLDFNFDRKLTKQELEKIEKLVNKKINESIPVKREELSLQEAKKQGATGVFDSKYGNIVSVYTIEDFSKEICTGPHASNTSEIGNFKIIKEESSSLGVRRIKAEIFD